MKCKKCNNELKPTDKFCPECGEKVEHRNLSECPNCHQTIDEGVIICPYCKNNIHNYNATPSSTADKKLNKKNIKFTIAWIVCCLAAVFAIISISNSCSNKDVTDKTTEPTTVVQPTTRINIDVTNLTTEIIAKDISFGVSPDWNSDNSHSIYDCNGIGILSFSFKKLSDSADKEYLKIYDAKSNIEYISHNDKNIDNVKVVIADYIDNENYYYNAGFSYGGYFYTFNLSGKTNEQEICSQLGNNIIATIKFFELSQPETESPTDKQTNSSTEKPKSDISIGKTNALQSAKSYLEFSAFSYQGLIDQLEYEKYSNEEAVYAADNCGADWNRQAVKSAKSYIEYSAFSYKGLIDQLEYEKFTSSEATYGADNCGADWKEQAVKAAASYLEYSSFSKDSLINQLEYEGFTNEQAVYGAEQNGY